MSSVFVGGSRQVSKLPPQVRERLDNLISAKLQILVGDANGADKAAQRHFSDQGYPHVTVFCSGSSCRNNLGRWKTCSVTPPPQAKGFQFYAAKDREMAKEADFGLMVWDGKSAGTVLNILRLVQAGKKAVLYDTAKKTVSTFKSPADWHQFLAGTDPELSKDLRQRATTEEWRISALSADQPEPFIPAGGTAERRLSGAEAKALAAAINDALGSGNPSAVVEVLGTIARGHGMTQLAKDAGLARESLYRSLSASGNPEFATVFRVLKSLGLRLSVDEAA